MSDEVQVSAEVPQPQITPQLDPHVVKLHRKVRQTRIAVWVLAVIIALNTVSALVIGQLYERPTFSTGAAAIDEALATYKLNDASSTTVYQQIVTNGWVARDLLETIGNQNATIIEQNADANWITGWLLFNILFTLGWLSIAMIRIGLMQMELSMPDAHRDART